MGLTFTLLMWQPDMLCIGCDVGSRGVVDSALGVMEIAVGKTVRSQESDDADKIDYVNIRQGMEGVVLKSP
jgi:hypothetical protein